MRRKKVTFNRKPSLDRAKTYKLKTPTKEDIITNIQDAVESLSNSENLKLHTAVPFNHINNHHYSNIEQCNYYMAIVILYVKGQEPELSEIEYEQLSLSNLEGIYSDLKTQLAETV
jgi:hypothetical protein